MCVNIRLGGTEIAPGFFKLLADGPYLERLEVLVLEDMVLCHGVEADLTTFVVNRTRAEPGLVGSVSHIVKGGRITYQWRD